MRTASVLLHVEVSPAFQESCPLPPSRIWTSQGTGRRQCQPAAAPIDLARPVRSEGVGRCRKRKKRPDRGSNPGLPHHMRDALPLSYPAGLWRNHQLQQRGSRVLYTLSYVMVRLPYKDPKRIDCSPTFYPSIYSIIRPSWYRRLG